MIMLLIAVAVLYGDLDEMPGNVTTYHTFLIAMKL